MSEAPQPRSDLFQWLRVQLVVPKTASRMDHDEIRETQGAQMLAHIRLLHS